MTTSHNAGLCRFCAEPLREEVIDLGVQPLANALRSKETPDTPEQCYPLRVMVCGKCYLVQLQEFASPDTLFSDYVYFSSFSESWLRHAETFSAESINRLGLGKNSFVVEVASNDGYLLQYFQREGVPVLGIDPAVNVASEAQAKGIDTLVRFFGAETAREVLGRSGAADLIIANNVLAHVPDLNDFVAGLKILLAPKGVVSIECPHLMNLITECQFDTIYHEHFSYFSLLTIEQIFTAHGMEIFDVEILSTHGGSLRIFAGFPGTHAIQSKNLSNVRKQESDIRLDDFTTYQAFAGQAHRVRGELYDFIKFEQSKGRRFAGYGAPAKGNTFLNFCGIGPDMIPFTVDRSPHKVGHFLPGSGIPVRNIEAIREQKPDYLLILPWNWQTEIVNQMSYIKEWGGQFVIAIPKLTVLQ